MFLRSKIQEMILRRRARSVNSAGGAQRSHVPDQVATSSTVPPCDGDGGDGAGSKSPAAARALFASPTPRLLHSSSLPAGGTAAFVAKSPTPPAGDAAEPGSAFSVSPTSVLDAAAAFVPGADGGAGNRRRRRQWRARDNNGLADALDDHHHHQQQEQRIVLAPATPSSSSSLLVRSCSLDRRVEFGVKNKSSWLPLRASSSGREAPSPAAAAADPREIMEPSSEDYTCVISRGPNPRTVHIFGDRVVEDGSGDGNGAAGETTTESSPRPINLPASGDRGFFSL